MISLEETEKRYRAASLVVGDAAHTDAEARHAADAFGRLDAPQPAHGQMVRALRSEFEWRARRAIHGG